MTYDDARLAALYDGDNPPGVDHDYFRAFVNKHAARSVADVGCGTGSLTVTLATTGRDVVGIDPAAAMLDVAHNRPGGDAVRWLLGGHEQLRGQHHDVVLMTGNVAMHLIGDEWPATLRAIADTLTPGGRLAFETRNPAAREWQHWHQPPTTRDTPLGPLRESANVQPPDADGVVEMVCMNEFLATGEHLQVPLRLQFRDHQRIQTDLTTAGFTVDQTWCSWDKKPFTGNPHERVMIFEATRT